MEDGLVFELSGDTASMSALLDALDETDVNFDTRDDGTHDGYGATVWPTSLDATRDELAQFLRNAADVGGIDIVFEVNSVRDALSVESGDQVSIQCKVRS